MQKGTRVKLNPETCKWVKSIKLAYTGTIVTHAKRDDLCERVKWDKAKDIQTIHASFLMIVK